MSEPTEGTSSESLNLKSLKRKVIIRFVMGLPFLGLMFFLPAWTFNYWQAWIYMLMLFVPMSILVRYLYKHDPELLERRMKMKERQKTQKLIVAASFLFSLGLM